MDLADLLDGTDELVALDAAYSAAWTATDEGLLAVCRDRVAMLLGCTVASHDELVGRRQSLHASEIVTDRERVALDFTEQFVVDVASITDRQAGALREHLGDEGLASFVNALLVIEQRMTLELAFEGVM